MILVLDASAANQTRILLCSGGRVLARRSLKRLTHETERLLPAIDALLRSRKSSAHTLKGIAVVRGPGSFTAIRLAVAIANTFGQILRIPVVGIRSTEYTTPQELVSLAVKRMTTARHGVLVRPFYGRPPHITLPKERL